MQLRQILPDAHWVVIEDHVAGLLTSDLRERLEQYCTEGLSTFAADYNIAMGFSDMYEDPSQSAHHYAQAMHACNTVPSEGPACGIRAFSEVYLDYLIGILREHDSDQALVHPALIQLVEYDKAHHTELAKMLKVYLRLMKNTGLAAEALNVHRNSLLYRLNRINEITQLNLDDGDEAFRLLLSFRLLESPPHFK